MYRHDPFLRLGHVRRARRVRWQWGRQRPGPDVRVGRPCRRRLAAIERALMADTPALSAKFTVFNLLTDGERPVGAEQLPGPAWPGTRHVHLAVLLVVAAFVAAFVTLCVTLSAQVHQTVSPCPVVAAAGASAHAPVRGLACPAYPTAK